MGGREGNNHSSESREPGTPSSENRGTPSSAKSCDGSGRRLPYP